MTKGLLPVCKNTKEEVNFNDVNFDSGSSVDGNRNKSSTIMVNVPVWDEIR